MSIAPSVLIFGILSVLSFGVACSRTNKPAKESSRALSEADLPGCAKETRGGSRSLVTADPANEPDKFAWQTFVHINQNADDGTQNLRWESWATDVDLFPADPNQTPDWNKRHTTDFVLEPIVQRALAPVKPTHLTNQEFALFPPDGNGGQEVRVNQCTFSYVVAHQLWYQEGLVKSFNDDFTINFPQAATEVKAKWEKFDRTDPSRYYWRKGKDEQGKSQVYVLTALHVITKAVPNWTWATFEHVDNRTRKPGHDSFGFVGKDDGPHTPPSNELQQLFKKGSLSDVWFNYRLQGTQTDFTTPTGLPTVLANSRLERNPKQSCMTCHAQAFVNDKAMVTQQQDPDLIGIPDCKWFYHYSDPDCMRDQPPITRQVDFVWSFQNARSRRAKPDPFLDWLASHRKVIPKQ